MTMPPKVAAELLRAFYRDPEMPHIANLRIGGVAARIVLPAGDYGLTLLIQGTDERRDWTMFNLRWWPVSEVAEGDTRSWHRGMLRYAEVVYAFAKGWLAGGGAITTVAGHSLGAAAAQIVGSSLGIRTLGFASPRPLWSKDQPSRAGVVVNYCRTDDLVCRSPAFGFSHVGVVRWLDPDVPHRGEDHRIEHYLEML